MVHARPTLPSGHGELVCVPPYDEWAGLLASNRALADSWSFEVGGLDAAGLRALARREALDAGETFSARLGVAVRAPGGADQPIVATGHQPEFYHPGVWVKDFLLQRLSDETGASAVDIVVDSDGFDSLAITSPCMTPGVSRCRQYLALSTPGSCYAATPVPSQRDIADFCRATAEQLSSLPAPSVGRHFAEFCSAIEGAAGEAETLAELVTIARRRFEAPAGTDYLELPLTSLTAGEAFGRFVIHLAAHAAAFAADYNAELAEYRSVTGTRSPAQPFPDLGVEGGRVELPLWALLDGRRETVWAVAGEDATTLVADGTTLVELPHPAEKALSALLAADVAFAPKALALTTFVRLFCCDLFIHGVGGGRYDRVTDGVIRRFFGVEPPRFVVASLTLYLPLGVHRVTDEEVAQATDRLNRLSHNPDALLGEVDFDSEDERERVTALAAEKAGLVDAIAQEGADKKALGLRIREVNALMAAALSPLRVLFEAELESLKTQREAADILTDRTYPFCFWDPVEVADKVR